MADTFTLKWKVLQSDLGRVQRGMLPTVRAIVAKAAMDIEANAKRRAPVDTGTLRNSIRAIQIGGNSSAGSVRWHVVVGAEYGVHVEWGTRYAPAQPYLRPAVADVQPGLQAALRKVIAR